LEDADRVQQGKEIVRARIAGMADILGAETLMDSHDPGCWGVSHTGMMVRRSGEAGSLQSHEA
jgi:hypothetical protein